jgi:hypothetical protein
VILDHYLLGDGSPDGARTRRRKAHLDDTVPNLLVAAGFEEWTRLETFHDVVEKFRAVLGPDRVGVSAAGFSAIVDAAMAASGPPRAQGSAAAT